jgi:MraZ protein
LGGSSVRSDMLRVRCQARATVDDKGRVSLPSPVRRALEEGSVGSLVVCCYQGALWAWTPEDYERGVESRMDGIDPFNAHAVDFVHAVLAVAEEVEVDKTGRIRLPVELREMAGIRKDVQVFSVLDRLEIWDLERWQARFTEARARASALGGMPRGEIT